MLVANENIDFSHSILSYIHAGFYGKLIELSITNEINIEEVTAETFEAVQQKIRFIEAEQSKVLEGNTLIDLKWEAPETEEAKSVFSLAQELAMDLESTAEIVERLLTRKDFHNLSRPEHGVLLASYARLTHARDDYLKSFQAYFEQINDKTQIKQYKDARRQTAKEIEYCGALIEALEKGKELTLEYFHALYAEVVILPGAMRTQIHDLRMLWTIFAGPFSFENAGLLPDIANGWRDLGISPIEAGYWSAHIITPEEAKLWMEHNIPEPAVAGLWRSWRFPPQDARLWLEAEFTSPAEAVEWANAGHEPEEARKLINRGVSHPSLIVDKSEGQ